MHDFPPSLSAAVHVPVLPREVLRLLDLTPGLRVVDGTVGAGGHCHKIAAKILAPGWVWGLDRDPMMLRLATAKLSVNGELPENVRFFQSSYIELPQLLSEQGQTHVDRLLVDLGLSSDQLSDDHRGFSFSSDGPLDLRFNPTAGQPAWEWLHNATADDIERVFTTFGEEPRAASLAAAIVVRRQRGPFTSAKEFAAFIADQLGVHLPVAKHPATRIFQALRIEVNAELEHVRKFVETVAPQVLAPGGRLAVITFHSLEDRLVKQAFKNTAVWEAVTDKPVEPTPAEVRVNPRSRSAKLRVAVRCE